MNLTNEQLRSVQLKQLECMVEIDRICRGHNLRYYLIGGTLLGAVRHEGFIPWDDDLDIAMPREDYDRFMKIGQELLGEKYFLQNSDTDPYCFVPFAKVRINGTLFRETSAAHLECHHGVFVDIFSLDMVASTPLRRRFDLYIQIQIMAIIYGKLGIGGQRRPWLMRVRRTIGKFVSIRILGRLIHRRLRRYQNKSTGYLAMSLSAYPDSKEMLTPEGYGVPVELEFEGHRFFAPAQYEKLLEQVYGDYMTLPPENERGGWHAISELKL